MFLKKCELLGITGGVAEYKFSSTRKFRFDFAFPDKKVAIEINGGVWMSGKSRHFYGSGALRDMVKMSLAAELGWRILIYPSLNKIDYDQLLRTLGN